MTFWRANDGRFLNPSLVEALKVGTVSATDHRILAVFKGLDVVLDAGIFPTLEEAEEALRLIGNGLSPSASS